MAKHMARRMGGCNALVFFVVKTGRRARKSAFYFTGEVPPLLGTGLVELLELFELELELFELALEVPELFWEPVFVFDSEFVFALFEAASLSALLSALSALFSALPLSSPTGLPVYVPSASFFSALFTPSL